MKTPCRVDGCTKPSRCRNMCNSHYRMFMRYGDPLFRRYAEAGTGTKHNSGYWMYEINGRCVMRHILIVEKAIGHSLPLGAEVHHVDGVRSNDDPSNLVVCQDRNYHQLLHKRTKAFAACGHADWLSCQICKQYSPPEEITSYSNGVKWHSACWAKKFGKRGMENGRKL